MASRRSKLPDSFPKQWPVYQQLYGKRRIKLTDDEWAAHCFLAGYDQRFSAKGDPLPINYDPENLDPAFVRVSHLKGELESFGREALIRVLERAQERALKTKRFADLLLLKDLFALFLQSDEYASRKLIFRFRSRKPRESTKARAVAYFIEKLKHSGATPQEIENKVMEVWGYKDARSIKKVRQKDKRNLQEHRSAAARLRASDPAFFLRALYGL
jgi:hypothetical protein